MHEVLDVLFFRTEGFFSCLGGLCGGLGISKLQFLIRKIYKKFSAVQFLVIKILDPDPQLEKIRCQIYLLELVTIMNKV